MFLFLIFFTLIILYFIAEKRQNDRCLASFTAVIHVNGIRGKTSTCRYLDAALRSRYRVFTKTTGTDAKIIDVSGKELPIRRHAPANIHEQLKIIRRAHREGAQILILECMAVNPELQKIAQTQIVRSNLTVITNVRYDHIFEMGDSLEEIASSLSSTIPENGTLYTADAHATAFFADTCQKRNCHLICCPATGTSSENIDLARAVSSSLGISEKAFLKSLPEMKEDFGARHLYSLSNRNGEAVYFLNLFSANDPQSTRNLTEEARQTNQLLFFLYNHREDRPDRALLFARYFFPHYPDTTVFLTGRGAALPKRLFTNAGIKTVRLITDYHTVFSDLPENSLLVGIGNIKGAGYQLIEELESQKLFSQS